MKGDVKRIEIVAEVRELLHDIKNKSWLRGRTLEAADYDAFERASNMQATDEEAALYELKRSLSRAWSELRGLLNEWLCGRPLTGTDNRIDEELDEEGQLRLELELPGNYRREAAGGLGHEVHSYLVDRALYEWYVLTSPEEAGQWLDRSRETGDRIMGLMYMRERPARPRYGIMI